MSANLPLFLGFLGALLASVGAWRTRLNTPGGMAIAAVGSVLLGIVTLIYLLALLGAVALA